MRTVKEPLASLQLTSNLELGRDKLRKFNSDVAEDLLRQSIIPGMRAIQNRQ
jgi:hypothetical protein